MVRAATPEERGFSSERLQRLTGVVHADVDQGLLPGAVILTARHGKTVYHEAIGFQDREQRVAIKTDATFRIASLTKPITSVEQLIAVWMSQIPWSQSGHYRSLLRNMVYQALIH